MTTLLRILRGRALSRADLSRLFSEYGMLAVLLLLCTFFSFRTMAEQRPTGDQAGISAARLALAGLPPDARVILAAGTSPADLAFTRAAAQAFAETSIQIAAIVNGTPADLRRAIDAQVESGLPIHAIVVESRLLTWPLLDALSQRGPPLRDVRVIGPDSHRWPNFLKRDNLINIANQIVVIAILAIGMTMVIITAGIDLSVGSLVALSAVTAALVIRDLGGAENAGMAAMTAGALAGIAICALMGLFSGCMVTFLSIPPFIVTLGIMLVGSGLAYLLSQGQSIYQLPDSFIWLGRGYFAGIPVAVILMVLLYFATHVLMTRTVLGRYIYAVGGNAEAARLSGVPVRRVLLFVYTASGALAGLGGIITASQLKSGSPQYGLMYELYVIAAVVVGGTSLAGGEGRIIGTLIGAFIIAVIQNGMNLTGVESYTQKVVFGVVILGAVALDTLRRRGLRFLTRGLRT